MGSSFVNASILAAATAAAGTILEHEPSVLQNFASNVVYGMFAGLAGLLHHSFWRLPSSPSTASTTSTKAHKSRWNGMIGPDGEKTVNYRQGALYESVLNKGYGNRLLVQDGDGILPPNDDAEDGNLEGPIRRPRSDWEQERERIKERQRLKEEAGGTGGPIPSYILEYAPLVHLYSHEMYWPGDIAYHLEHTTLTRNYTNITNSKTNLRDLSLMNEYAPFVYLTSDDDVEQYPQWLSARHNIPNATTGVCDAPGTLIWIDKGNGIVDAFWFYFYSYNLGNMVFNVRFGNHIGDWEHSMVRFVNREPKWIFLSQHTGGDAYKWEALSKVGKRPVIYSATGTHAMYATAGKQEYIVPLGLLADFTDNGPVWDLTKNSRMYSYNLTDHMLLPADNTPDAETEWFYFDGMWGDKTYPQSDPRQYILLGEKHYSSGPMGPRWKNLGRKTVCQSDDECFILTRLRKGRKKWAWEMDPLDGGVEIPWWALGGLDWYLVCWAIVEWVVSAFVLKFGRAI